MKVVSTITKEQQMKNIEKQCSECRDGEHENLDDDVQLCTVINPDGGRPKRLYLCGEHVEQNLADGYLVKNSSGVSL